MAGHDQVAGGRAPPASGGGLGLCRAIDARAKTTSVADARRVETVHHAVVVRTTSGWWSWRGDEGHGVHEGRSRGNGEAVGLPIATSALPLQSIPALQFGQSCYNFGSCQGTPGMPVSKSLGNIDVMAVRSRAQMRLRSVAVSGGSAARA